MSEQITMNEATEQTPLRKLFDDACVQIDNYKQPSIDEFKAQLDALLQAAQLGSIRHEYIESITDGKDTIWIETSWSARGCSNSSSYQIPSTLIDAVDPIAAATLWGAQRKLDEAQSHLNKVRRDLEWAQARADEAQAALNPVQAAQQAGA